MRAEYVLKWRLGATERGSIWDYVHAAFVKMIKLARLFIKNRYSLTFEPASSAASFQIALSPRGRNLRENWIAPRWLFKRARQIFTSWTINRGKIYWCVIRRYCCLSSLEWRGEEKENMYETERLLRAGRKSRDLYIKEYIFLGLKMLLRSKELGHWIGSAKVMFIMLQSINMIVWSLE